MRVFRATNLNVIPWIEAKIRPADGVSKDEYLENLKLWLVNNPETVFLQVAFQGREEPTLCAFMVAYLPPQVDYIFVSQVWSSDEKIAAQLLVRAAEWGSYMMRTQVRMETESDHDGWCEKWGMKKITETRGLKFSELMNKNLLEQLEKEYAPTDTNDRTSGEATPESASSPDAGDSPVQSRSVSENNPHAERDVRDRPPAQDEALQHSAEGKSEGNG